MIFADGFAEANAGDGAKKGSEAEAAPAAADLPGAGSPGALSPECYEYAGAFFRVAESHIRAGAQLPYHVMSSSLARTAIIK